MSIQDFDDDFDKLALEPDVPKSNESMIPPSKSLSIVDQSEEVPHERAKQGLHESNLYYIHTSNQRHSISILTAILNNQNRSWETGRNGIIFHECWNISERQPSQEIEKYLPKSSQLLDFWRLTADNKDIPRSKETVEECEGAAVRLPEIGSSILSISTVGKAKWFCFRAIQDVVLHPWKRQSWNKLVENVLQASVPV